MKKLLLIFFLSVFCFTVSADPSGYGTNEVSLSVSVGHGNITVHWRDHRSNPFCDDHMHNEQIYYRVGTTGAWTKIAGTGLAGGSYTLTTLPGSFFEQKSDIQFRGDWCETNAGLCGGGCRAVTATYSVNPGVKNISGLSATMDQHCDKVVLNWTAPSYASAGPPVIAESPYRRYQVAVDNNGSAGTIIYDNVHTSFADVNAPSGVSRKYHVRHYLHLPGARNAVGQWNQVTGRKYGAPGQATGVFLEQANCSGDINVNWNWSSSTNPDNFIVHRATNPGMSQNLVGFQVSGSDRSYRDVGVGIGAQVYYQVFARDDCPNSTTLKALSLGSSIETEIGNGVPPAPSMTGIAIDTVGKAITVSWTNNTNLEDEFQIVRQGGGGAQSQFTVGANVTSYTDNSADNCENYTYKVKTINTCKTSGVISANQVTGYIPTDVSAVFAGSNKIEAGDGEAGDRIDLKWKTSNRQIDDWLIYRINPLINDTVPLASVTGNTKSYTDRTANANTLYKYLIQGETDCAGNLEASNTSEDFGFRLAFGTINGQVTYSGGTAVKGVKVVAEAASGSSGHSGNFNGTSSYAEVANADMLETDSFTIQSYVRVGALSGINPIISKGNSTKGFRFGFNGTSLELRLNGTTFSVTDSNISANNWFSVSASVHPDSVYLFVNQNQVLANAHNIDFKDTVSNLLIGKEGSSYFNGQLDELKYFNKSLVNQDVVRSYDVYINPSMDGLVGYWRFDEGFGDYAYDYSKTNLLPNKNHAQLKGSASFNGSKPSASQLTAGAYTDERGSYFIPFVPFQGTGDNYRITPSFGTHTFSPATTSIFIGGSSPNFTAIDFTDNSSFDVTGSVKFKNSSCFVKDIFVKIDGEIVIQNGTPVKTDGNGAFSVQVPIGHHVISVEAQNHVFSEGRFPKTGTWDFQQNENLNPFIDSTLVTVVGRVAGGGAQAKLPPGMGRGKNNMGIATIQFKSQQGNGCLDTTVTTDKKTGEYRIQLPPMKYDILPFNFTHNAAVSFGSEELNLSSIPPVQTEIDTVFVDSFGIRKIDRIDSVKYQTQRDFIKYNTPSIFVLDRDFDTVKYGADTISFEALIGSVNIPADSVDFNYPIFLENKKYKFQVLAYEVYSNMDSSVTINDSVPLPEGKFIINNRLAGSPVYEYEVTPRDTFQGSWEYEFTAGQANTSTHPTPAYSFTKEFEISLVTPNSPTVKWEPNKGDGTPSPNFRGIIFGGKALGNSFVTQGPQVVTMILRDPPGTNSSSSWEQNTEVTTVSKFENGGGVGFNFKAELALGTKFSVGLGYTTESEITNSLTTETKVETSVNSSDEYVEVTSKSVAISTGDNEEFVGAGSDLFFGRSFNMDFGLAEVMTFIDTADCGLPANTCVGSIVSFEGRDYKLGTKFTMFIVPGGYGTEFVYTQDGIENLIIPRLEALRNQLLSPPGTQSALYISNLQPSDDNYGLSNDDPVFDNIQPPVGITDPVDPERNTPSDAVGVSYSFYGYKTVDTTAEGVSVKYTSGVDSVWWYNRQINLWKEALKANEREKVLANNTNKVRNISYQAGPTITYTESSKRDTTETTTVNFNLSEDLSLSVAAKIGGAGVQVDNAWALNYSHVSESSTTTSYNNTFSYSINDTDSDDDFTVDVFSSREGYGPIFKTRGGQTSCPYQGEETTTYYSPGRVINAATIQLEQPGIDASPSSLFNVPADNAGVITLTLTNDGLEDAIYGLKVLENTNPNGAILKIDGINPNRNFAVPAKTSIVKQLLVEKGPIHIAYDSIGLVFHSTCQYAFGTAGFEDIADTVYFSVNFLPSCTEVRLSQPENQFVMNNSFDNELEVVIQDYDINYGGLDKIHLEYKPSSRASWSPISEEWFKDTVKINERQPKPTAPDIIPTDKAFISYKFDAEQLIDQDYQFRAVSTCKIPGNPDVQEISDVISGTFDRVDPHPFGTPSPADGVLDPNDDISIQFNEEIEAGSLTLDNFSVTGVVNGQELRHSTAVSFNGTNQYLEIDNGFDIGSSDFTIEFWAKRGTLGTNQTVISQGQSATNNFRIFFNSSNQLEAQVGSRSFATNFQIEDDSTWNHYTVTYTGDSTTLEITNRATSTTRLSNNNKFVSNYVSAGKTYFGKSAILAAPDYFDGSIHQIRIWNRALTPTEVIPNINRNLHGRERGLVGYWPMEEGKGNLAEDIARFRHAELNADWEFNPKSSAASFDGTDDYTMIDSASFISVLPEMDMTIEFWFKTTGGKVQTLFSNGAGLFHAGDVNRNSWNIEMDASNQIHVKHDSMDFIAVSADYADNNWHHFALVLNRLTNLSAYVDAQLQNSTDASPYGGLGGQRIVIGSRFIINGTVFSYDQAYNGQLDEVRIWNTSRLRDQIELEMYNRLKGDEFGLLAYYPFETYTVELGVPKLTPSFTDEGPSTRGLNSTATNGAAHTSNSPAIALQKPVKNIAYSWSVNNDKIVITTNEQPANIENVTMNVSVKGIKDLHGNRMQSPKTWIAYVNKNQVIWQDAVKNINLELNDTASFTTKIVNSGGEVKQFTISNIPNWLQVSTTSGTIDPLSTETVRFTIKAGVNIGKYSEDILLSTDFGFNEKLLVNLNVKKTPPSFAFDPSLYQYSMSIIGQIRINGEVSNNGDDYLVALHGDEVRGFAQLQYIENYDQYFAFLDVYSNTNDSIQYQVWSAAKGELLIDVSPEMIFKSDSIVGSPTNPQMFDAEDKVKLDIVLNQGWNWVSFPVESEELTNLDELFNDVTLAEGDLIKTIGFNATAQYGMGTKWTGRLSVDGLNLEKSYLIKLSQKDTLTLRGFAVDPDTMPIQLVPGWNRIGYISLRNIAVNTALANYNATEGDVLKSQQQFAYYDDRLGWIGSLQVLQPTEGLLLKTNDSVNFVYPRSGLLRMKEPEKPQTIFERENDIRLLNMKLTPSEFESSTSAIIDIDICEELLVHPDFGLAAFSGDKLRGWISHSSYIEQDDNYRYFMTIYGEGNESFEFKLINLETQELIDLNGNLSFEKNKVQGTPDNPIQFFSLREIDCSKYAIDEELVLTSGSLVFPNPFNERITIQIPEEYETRATISLIDDLGRVILVKEIENQRSFTWSNENATISNLKPGVYQIRIESNDKVYTEKVIKI